jgi:predicted esterase
MKRPWGLVIGSIVAAFFLVACQPTDIEEQVSSPAVDAVILAVGPLYAEQFGNGDSEAIILLHGDVSRGGAADYLYSYARQMSRAKPDATVYAMLRPGYFDSAGNRSTGSNHDRRDHYTSRNNALIAATIRSISAMHANAKVTVMGHSGGAASLGVIIGREPGLVDKAVLVSCPCNISRWRKLRGRSAWPRSQSPYSYAGRIAQSTQVHLVVGVQDDNTVPILSEEFAARLGDAGISVDLQTVAGAGHGFGGALASKAMQILKSP